jgi:hypothetical protein
MLFVLAFIHGCALTEALYAGRSMSQAPVQSPAVGLQDPPPGKSILYLLRTPDDRMDIAVFVNGRKFVELPEGAYTAIALPPGRHLVTTRAFSWMGDGLEIAPQAEIDIREDERRFFSIAGAAASPAQAPLDATGLGTRTHRWKEVGQTDAQGLMSLTKVVLPEEEAL